MPANALFSSIHPGKAGLTLPCHFGEWLQGTFGPSGPVALVTLVPQGIGMRARRSSGALTACRFGAGAGVLPLPMLRRFLNELHVPVRGRFHLQPRFVPGSGTGMSTSALIAVAALSGFRGPISALAQACINAEGASDPLMFPAPDQLLWASRQGGVLDHLPPPPKAHLLAGFWGPPQRTRASDSAYDDISDLVAEWKRAPSLARCAELASESALRCQIRRGPSDDPTPDLAKELGALGWVRSHSGPARALVFAPGTLPITGLTALRQAGYWGAQLLSTGTR